MKCNAMQYDVMKSLAFDAFVCVHECEWSCVCKRERESEMHRDSVYLVDKFCPNFAFNLTLCSIEIEK